MLGFGIHLKQATHNKNAALKAAQSGYPDWAVTMCFYAALHYVKACEAFRADNIYKDYPNGKSQHERTLFYVLDIDTTPKLSVYAAYETLLEASKISRYLSCISTSSKHHFLNKTDEYFDMLSVIETFFKPLLNIP